MHSFESILRNCLKEGAEYRQSPPQGPPDEYAALSDEALAALNQTEHGEDSQANRGGVYSPLFPLRIPDGEDVRPCLVDMPDADELADIHVCGIDGSNQRVQRSAFQLIMARACIIAFRYSKSGKKPYFYHQVENAEAVVWVDGNIFDGDQINIRTKKPLNGVLDFLKALSSLSPAERMPMIMRYKRGEMKKSPSGYALGVAVQLHQALELLCVVNARARVHEANMVCIKDGPLLPTSTSVRDTVNGLSSIFSWKKGQVLIACSKRVSESPLLLETLLSPLGALLKESWFPGQRIVDDHFRALASDAILLPRILKPGHRTPFIEAVPVARSGVVKEESGLTPLSCYYLSRSRPHTYIRMEVPRCMWESDRDGVHQAVKIAAWQHELGRAAPLVQLEADKQCDLSAERRMLEWQTANALAKRKLNFLEDYDE